jgi:hypothetical protein
MDVLAEKIFFYRKALQAGSSKPWPDTLEEMTGSRKIDAGPMLEYFKPLNDWLDQVTDIRKYSHRLHSST